MGRQKVGIGVRERGSFLTFKFAKSKSAKHAANRPNVSQTVAARGRIMSDINARPTDRGTVLLAITDGENQRVHVELPVEVAEQLEAQIHAALITARAIGKTHR